MRSIVWGLFGLVAVGCDDGGGEDPVEDAAVAPEPQPEGEPAPQPDGEPAPQPEGEPAPQPEGEPAPQPEGEPEPEPPAAGWSSGPAVGTGPIQEIAVVALNQKIYVIGGFDAQARVVNRVSAFDPATGAWAAVAPIPARMHHANAAVLDGKIWVVGFLDGLTFSADRRAFVYDPAADAWSPGPDLPPMFGRGAAGTVAIGRKIYVVGGLSGRAVYPFVHAYDVDAGAWERLPDLPTIRDHMAIGAVAGKIVVAGGRAGDINSHVDRVDVFDPAVGEWTIGAPMPTSRGGCAAAVVGDELVVIGGEGNRGDPSGVYAAVEAYDAVNDAWRSLDPMPVPKHGMWAAAIDGVIYVPGGATVQAFGAVDDHAILVP